jgi:hypothetical protein
MVSVISAISSAFTLMFLCTRPTTNTKHKSSLKEIEVDIDLSDSVDDRNKTVRHIDYPPKNERLKVKNENKGNDNKSKGSKFNDTKSNNRDSGKKNLELSKEEKGKNIIDMKKFKHHKYSIKGSNLRNSQKELEESKPVIKKQPTKDALSSLITINKAKNKIKLGDQNSINEENQKSINEEDQKSTNKEKQIDYRLDRPKTYKSSMSSLNDDAKDEDIQKVSQKENISGFKYSEFLKEYNLT